MNYILLKHFPQRLLNASFFQVGKLSFFRQNAAIITRKKEQTAEKMNELRSEITNYQEEMRVSVGHGRRAGVECIMEVRR